MNVTITPAALGGAVTARVALHRVQRHGLIPRTA